MRSSTHVVLVSAAARRGPLLSLAEDVVSRDAQSKLEPARRDAQGDHPARQPHQQRGARAAGTDGYIIRLGEDAAPDGPVHDETEHRERPEELILALGQVHPLARASTPPHTRLCFAPVLQLT